MPNILLGVTGSVAAIYTPQLYCELRQAGYQVKVVATEAALYFFDAATLQPDTSGRDPEIVILDQDEWPRRPQGERYERSDPVLHIELRRWADMLLIAPLDANTLAKMAGGLTDNCLTCVWRAWDRNRPVVLAPAMNTLMWEHPATRRHLRQVAEDFSELEPPTHLNLESTIAWIDAHCARFFVLPPQCKRLACDDVGVGAMADREQILSTLRAFFAETVK